MVTTTVSCECEFDTLECEYSTSAREGSTCLGGFLTCTSLCYGCFFFFQAEDGIRDLTVTGVQTCALPISVPLVSAEPMPRAKAPACMKSTAFKKSIPPVGIGRSCGKGPNRSRRYPGPRRTAGKILIISTPASKTSPTSLGARAPGTYGMRADRALSSTFSLKSGETKKRAPAAI